MAQTFGTVLLICLLAMAQLTTGGYGMETRKGQVLRTDEAINSRGSATSAPDLASHEWVRRTPIPDVQPDIYDPSATKWGRKLPKDKMKPVMVPWRPKDESSKDETNRNTSTSDLGSNDAGIDVRCRWKLYKKDDIHVMDWDIWVSPNDNEYPDWCKKLELSIRNACRNQDGRLLQENDPKDKKDRLKWTKMRY